MKIRHRRFEYRARSIGFAFMRSWSAFTMCYHTDIRVGYWWGFIAFEF